MLQNWRRKRNLFYLLAAIILVVGFLSWQSELRSDPPMHFSGFGQSLSTDPPMYSFHARNKIQFGDFDPLKDPRWEVFKYSLVSVSSLAWLSITGVSFAYANLVAVFLVLGGLLLFLLALYRHHSPWVLAAIALTYVINVVLFTYGRLTYLENGLIFLIGLLLFVYSRWGERVRGIAACGVVIGLATLIGKLFGALLLPALAAAILVSSERRRWQRVGVAAGAFAATTIIMIFLLFGTHLWEALGYFGQQSWGLHGYPDGLVSPWGFIEHLISFGFTNRLFYLSPDLLGLLLVGLFIATVLLRGTPDFIQRLSPPARLTLFWVGILLLGLMPLNYSPLRYSISLIPGIILLAFTMIDVAMGVRPIELVKPRRSTLLALGLSGWAVAFHLSANYFYFGAANPPIRMLVWTTLPWAIIAAVGGWYLLKRRQLFLSRRVLIATTVILLVGSVSINSLRIRRNHVLENCFTAIEANHDLPNVLGPEAVIAGPYAAALTVENDLKSIIHFFGVNEADSDFFRHYPVTHLALDESNWKAAVSRHPELVATNPVASYWIRDFQVNIYNISKIFDNPEATAYRESKYEQAIMLSHRGKFDSALTILGPEAMRAPTSKVIGVLHAELLLQKGDLDKAAAIAQGLAERYPTDFSIQLACGQTLQGVALLSRDSQLLSRAESYYARAVATNRYRAAYAMSLWEQNHRRITGALSQLGPSANLAP